MASRDLTEGPIPQQLRTLWMPLLVAMTLQSLYALVNLVFVTQLGDRAVSGLAITIQAFFIVLAVGQVLGQTALADISQAYGRGDVGEARSALTSYSLLAVLLGVGTSLIAWLGAEAYVGLFTDDPEVFAQGVAYFEAHAATFLLQLLIIVFATSMRASGDFVTTTRIMGMSVLLNAALDPLLMFALDMGIVGAAWATVIAQAVACIAYFVLLRPAAQRDGRSLSWGPPRFSRELMRRIATRGVPAGIQFFLIFVLLGVVLAGMKPHGPDWTGAAGGGFRVLQQTWLPLVTLASAAAAMAGQSFGANNLERVAATGATAMRWGLLFGIAAAAAVFFGAPLLAHIAAKGEAQHAHVITYFRWSAPMLLVFGFTYIPTFMLQAMGRSFLPMVAAVVRVGLVTIVTLVLVPAFAWGPEAVFLATTAAAFVEGALGVYLLRRFLRSRGVSGARRAATGSSP